MNLFYLFQVDSSKNIEMVNIIGDDLWKPEPTLRPEDDIILRKLQDMLQSTSDDLKRLSGELIKFHKPGLQIKTVPTPLDEEFNEKVHIEELVNAKFHGYQIVNRSSMVPDLKLQNNTIIDKKPLTTKPLKPKVTNTAVQVNSAPTIKMKVHNKNLGISRTRIVQIDEKKQDNVATERLNNGKIIHKVPAVSYNEFSYNYVEPRVEEKQRKLLQVQIMPSINIRSELKEQKVLNIDILPDSQNKKVGDTNKKNVVVVAVNHEELITHAPVNKKDETLLRTLPESIKPVRKVSKMSTGESSESVYISSDARLRFNTHSKLTTAIKNSPVTTDRQNRKKKCIKVRESEKPQAHNVEEWRRKLNIVYGCSSTKNVKTNHKSDTAKKNGTSKKLNTSIQTGTMNNAQYIPYSQLTLGGVRVSDIEKELSNIPIKNNEPLSKVFDEILNSREHSTRDRQSKDVPKILTTSDENLLQEVIDIERTVSDTISKILHRKETDRPKTKISSDEDNENDSYADDFEDVNSDNTMESKNGLHVNGAQQDNYSKEQSINGHATDSDNNDAKLNKHHNATFTKASNLSIKDSVDIFEFIHSVDTQDIATQSSVSNKILPKETQTSPRNDRSNVQPIHNDLWPSIDPRGEIERMLKLEKEFIKKLIIDEYGDLLEKNIVKPSTSKDSVNDTERNIVASQKKTQTSPARVKSVMTSPRRSKTRTTSPFLQQATVTADQQTSPILVPNEDANINNEDITINLSSPRFNLRLPQNSHEVLSNLDLFSRSSSKILGSKLKPSSSSSVEAGSSSELSSLGEVRVPIRKRLKKSRVPSIPESISSSALSTCSSEVLSGGIIPLRSDGEVVFGQRTKKTSNKSEGETSFGIVL